MIAEAMLETGLHGVGTVDVPVPSTAKQGKLSRRQWKHLKESELALIPREWLDIPAVDYAF